MLKMSSTITPKHMGEENPREDILNLGKKITDVAKHKLHGVTSADPEYWGLAGLVNEDMAKIANAMKVREHYTFSQMKELCPSYDESLLRQKLDEMSNIGLLEYDYGNHYDHNGRCAPQSERRWCLPMFVPGSAELFNMDEDPETGENRRLEEHPEIAPFFERMTYIPLAGITQMVPPGGAGIGMHVIPVEKAIEMENKKVDLEQLSYWLSKYEDKLAVGQCSCRASRAKMNEGVADDAQAWCVACGDFADYCVETNKGHYITKDEALEIFQKAEDLGYVHQITNIDGDNKIFGICNCNINICNALRTSQLFNTPNMSASAYRASVDSNACVGCGSCVQVCPAGAVKLGQKLCRANGEKVEYPRCQLPDFNKWGEDKYDENYRETARINCRETGTAPCKTACPAHISIQAYLKAVADGDFDKALKIIKRDNPFPAVCGRVCDKRCEIACTRCAVDSAVAIDNVKKFVADRELNAENRFVPEIKMPVSPARHIPLTQQPQKIAIIGAGPAGLSCAFYLAQLGYKPVVFEKSPLPGGMMRYGIPSYKISNATLDAEIDVIKQLGVDIQCNVEVGKDVTLAQLREQGFEVFYVAIGCQGSRFPGVDNENAKGCDTAIHFLKDAYDGNAADLNGKKVVVVGGGNVALDCARAAIRMNPASVTIVSLESADEMPATDEEVSQAKKEGIVVLNGWGPKEVKVTDDVASSIVMKACTQVFVDGKFNPQYDEGCFNEIECDEIIFAIGQKIEWGNLLDGEDVEFWHGNYPRANELTFQTSVSDIFIGGDVYTGPKFVIDAIECGHQAAERLHRFVHKGASLTIGIDRREFIELDKDDVELKGYDNAERQSLPVESHLGFSEMYGNYTAEEAVNQAKRCLGCGASVVDPHKCIGCGVCTTKCGFDAIHLHKTHPEATHMIKAEDKFKEIGPYALKRAAKIALHVKPKEVD